MLELDVATVAGHSTGLELLQKMPYRLALIVLVLGTTSCISCGSDDLSARDGVYGDNMSLMYDGARLFNALNARHRILNWDL